MGEGADSINGEDEVTQMKLQNGRNGNGKIEVATYNKYESVRQFKIKGGINSEIRSEKVRNKVGIKSEIKSE